MSSFYERKQNGDGTTSTLTHQTGSLAKTIQTHNAVSVPLSGTSIGSWIDCDGFTDIAITLMNDATTASALNVNWSHDGTTFHGDEQVMANGSGAQRRVASVPIKAKYVRLYISNTDSALAHTMSAWVYLKA